VKTDADADQPLHVLLVDDEAETLLPVLAQEMEDLGFRFDIETTAARTLGAVARGRPDAVLLDLHFPGDDERGVPTTGGRLLAELKRAYPELSVVLFSTRLDDLDIPLEDFEANYDGCFAKPKFGVDRGWAAELASTIRVAVEAAARHSPEHMESLGFLVGRTAAMKRAAALVRGAARHPLNVLIHGETGSGKQAVAEAIHRLSGRNGTFQQLNCSGIHEETMDAMLFGYERGAFTGAAKSAPGLFELADGGTLFLDEIQRMPMALQNKLMLVLESKKIRRMGGSTDIPVNARLVAATNHELSDLVKDELLREDLAYRLMVVQIVLPPLRERLDDLEELFGLALAKANRAVGGAVKQVLRPETLQKLRTHPWRGNVRELEATIQRAVARASSNILLPADIELTDLATPKAQASESPSTEGSSQAEAISAVALFHRLDALPVEHRYAFVCQTDGSLRSEVLVEVVRALRSRQSRKVRHKDLAAYLDPLTHGPRDLERIRKMVHGSVNITELAFNQ
jgi:DNA-binding NtrC family response regulator